MSAKGFYVTSYALELINAQLCIVEWFGLEVIISGMQIPKASPKPLWTKLFLFPVPRFWQTASFPGQGGFPKKNPNHHHHQHDFLHSLPYKQPPYLSFPAILPVRSRTANCWLTVPSSPQQSDQWSLAALQVFGYRRGWAFPALWFDFSPPEAQACVCTAWWLILVQGWEFRIWTGPSPPGFCLSQSRREVSYGAALNLGK